MVSKFWEEHCTFVPWDCTDQILQVTEIRINTRKKFIVCLLNLMIKRIGVNSGMLSMIMEVNDGC